MGWEVGPPVDRRGWAQCPDCHVWYRKAEHTACPNCGYVFGQEESDEPAPALDDASLRAAQALLDVAGGLENARVALDKAAEEGFS
jgi:hypothetical protein